MSPETIDLVTRGSRHVTEIKQNWVKEILNLTDHQNERIGTLWITEILESDEEAVDRLKEDVVNDEIGLKHAGVVEFLANSRGFWKGVREVAPNLVKQEDLEFLIQNDFNGQAAWALITFIDELNPGQDLLTARIVGNSLLYK